MTEPRRTDDAIGVDLDTLRPSTASATLGQPVPPPERQPTRQHDGFPALELSESDRQAALKELGVDVPEASLTSHVRLDMRRPYVSGRGHVNLIRTWHVWSEVPRADWLRWLDVVNYGGFVEMWFRNLTANRQYLISLTVSGWWLNNNSAFKVNGPGLHVNYSTFQNYQVQYLYGLIKPTSDMALVILEPHQLEALSFYQAQLYAI